MGNKYSSYERDKKETINRATIPAEDTTIYGDNVIWNLTTPTSAYTVTVADYDQSKHNFWAIKGNAILRPCIIIRSKVDCSSYNVTIKNTDGDTLYTFSSDNSSTEEYCVLRIDSDREWELA